MKSKLEKREIDNFLMQDESWITLSEFFKYFINILEISLSIVKMLKVKKIGVDLGETVCSEKKQSQQQYIGVLKFISILLRGEKLPTKGILR